MKNLFISILLSFLLLFPLNLHKSVTPSATVSTSELKKQMQCLEESLYHEARGEPKEGLHAVLSVIYNRTKHPKFPSSYCAVVHQPYQFSYRNKTKQGTPIKTTYKPSELKIKATIDQLVFDAVAGRFKPSVDVSVVFYHSISMKTPDKWSSNFKFYRNIGRHIFYSKE